MREVLDIAIKNEEISHKFYMELMDLVEDDVSKDTLKFLAEEELGHKKILQQYQSGALKVGTLEINSVVDSRVVETLGTPVIKGNLEHKDIFLIAADREKSSHEFYEKMAALHPEGEIQKLFLKLAGEELKHKEKVEYLYCNAAFPQTAGG